MTTAVIQALATGLPCITTNHSAFPDQIIEGKNGFMVDEGDYQALADKILYLINHPELWPEFGRFGRQLMLERYDQKKLINEQIDYYNLILNANFKYNYY